MNQVSNYRVSIKETDEQRGCGRGVLPHQQNYAPCLQPFQRCQTSGHNPSILSVIAICLMVVLSCSSSNHWEYVTTYLLRFNVANLSIIQIFSKFIIQKKIIITSICNYLWYSSVILIIRIILCLIAAGISKKICSFGITPK